MVKNRRRWLWAASVAASLGLAGTALGQTSERGSFQPFKSLFGSKTPVPEQKKAEPAPRMEAAPRVDAPRGDAAPRTDYAQRVTEIMIELAWMSDPVTFPYFLEARSNGQSLLVRGYVPSKEVRAQALNLAKLHCSLHISDQLKEHPSVAVKSTRRTPEQLQAAVLTALREAFPGQPLNVQCTSEGNVRVMGNVKSLEQKLAVSQTLRRLHGCTSIANLTQVGGAAIVQNPPAGNTQTQAPVKTSPQVPVTQQGQAGKGATPSDQKRGPFNLFAKNPPAQAPTQPPQARVNTGDPLLTPPQVKTPAQNASLPKIQTVNNGTDSIKTPAQLKPGDPYETRGLVVLNPEESAANPAKTNPVAVPNQKVVQAPAVKSNPAPLPTPQVQAQPIQTLPPQTKPGQVQQTQGQQAQMQTAPPPKNQPVPNLSAAQLKKRIESAVPNARQVQVSFTSKTDVRIECTTRPTDDSGTIAGQILSLRDLEPYKVDLHIQMPAPDKK